MRHSPRFAETWQWTSSKNTKQQMKVFRGECNCPPVLCRCVNVPWGLQAFGQLSLLLLHSWLPPHPCPLSCSSLKVLPSPFEHIHSHLWSQHGFKELQPCCSTITFMPVGPKQKRWLIHWSLGTTQHLIAPAQCSGLQDTLSIESLPPLSSGCASSHHTVSEEPDIYW